VPRVAERSAGSPRIQQRKAKLIDRDAVFIRVG
jgi:hypothetical protein